MLSSTFLYGGSKFIFLLEESMRASLFLLLAVKQGFEIRYKPSPTGLHQVVIELKHKFSNYAIELCI